jgi:type IV secretory pathway VirB2 component (pilin)
MFEVSYALTAGSSLDPAGSGAIVTAVSWLQGTLLGTVATTVAVIAIASVGLMMLSGRIELRRGLTVVCGAFILFGAASIAAGIRSLAPGDYGGDAYPVVRYEAPPVAAAPAPTPPPAAYDPYAGASVPSG